MISATVRQWWMPREFRIGKAALPRTVLTALAEAASAVPTAAPEVDGPADTSDPALGASTVADVATSLWRLRGRMTADGEDGSRARSLSRQVDAAWDALTEAGVEVRDHLNDPFDLGLSITVVAYEPRPGLRREQVVRALRPTVLLNGRAIQKAEVIVGTPEDDTEQDEQP